MNDYDKANELLSDIQPDGEQEEFKFLSDSILKKKEEQKEFMESKIYLKFKSLVLLANFVISRNGFMKMTQYSQN
jgi:hypothetical protein